MGTIGLRVEGLVDPQRVKPGTFKRIIPFAMRHRRSLAIVMLATIVDSVITVSIPLMLKMIVDDGIVAGKASVVFGLAGLVAGLALLNVVAIYIQAWFSGRVGQGLIFDLRTKVFAHIQRQPVAFFTRTQTGSLVSRINTDIVGAEHALTTLLSQSLSTVLTLILVLGAMFYLSWPITLAALVMIPLFFIPGKIIAQRMERLARSGMQKDAELGSMMTERFNVSGAMLVKLYGRPEAESAEFSKKARIVRDIAISMDVHARLLFILVTLLTTVTTALVYGFGGWFVIDGQIQIGTLVAMVALLMMLYSPINQLTNIQSAAGPGFGTRERRGAPRRVRQRRLPLPQCRGSVPALPGVAAAAQERARSGRAGPERRELPRPGRAAHRAGRAVRGRQDHHHPSGTAAL
jgi:ATP-binding cassette subfamily B protein